MWTRSENSDSIRPDALEYSGNNVIVRKGFKLIPATEDIPEHYEYDEWQMTKDQYDVYKYCEGVAEETNIAFVTLAESGNIDEITATEHAEAFSPWEPNVDYAIGSLRRHEGKLYKCVQAHRSQEGWEPDKVPALWAKAGDPEEEWPDWSQPVGAQDAYMKGDKVSHAEKHWVSECDSNVWEPGVFGWTEA